MFVSEYAPEISVIFVSQYPLLTPIAARACTCIVTYYYGKLPLCTFGYKRVLWCLLNRCSATRRLSGAEGKRIFGLCVSILESTVTGPEKTEGVKFDPLGPREGVRADPLSLYERVRLLTPSA